VTDRILQRSRRRIVAVEEGGSVVRKTFTACFDDEDPEAASRLATTELGRLQRFHDALADVPGAACPRPIEVVAGPPAVLRMERAPGTPLLELLRGRRLPPGLLHDLATVAAAAVTRYVEAVGEPYYDFQFDNMLYDGPSCTLTFVDLGLPDRCPPLPPGADALEATLGNLVGSTMFQSARPKWALSRRRHRRAAALCAAIVQEVAPGDGPALTGDGLQPWTRAAYERSAFKGGRPERLWYGSVGYLLARRPRILGVRFSPPRRPPPRPRPRPGPRVAQETGRPSSGAPGRTNRK
jgi:hypothetical protein